MKFYYSRGSCSLVTHAALEEAGAKFEALKLELRVDTQKPEFLAITPKGKVPVLVLDDGVVLTENPAILSFIADTHPNKELLPPVGTVARAKAQEWMAWCASEVHPSFSALFKHAREKTQPTEEAKIRVLNNLGLYERWLAGKSYVLGDRFSVADLYTLLFTLWSAIFKIKAGPSVYASAHKLLERAGVQRMAATQQLQFTVS